MDSHADRAQYGFPTPPSQFRTTVRILVAVAVVMGVSALAGMAGGSLLKRRILTQTVRETAPASSSVDPVFIRSLLEAAAARLTDNTTPEARLLVAQLHLRISAIAPEQRMYLQRAAHRLEALRHEHPPAGLPPELRLQVELLDAAIQMELDNDEHAQNAIMEAWGAFGEIEGQLEPEMRKTIQGLLENAEAFLLASSSDPHIHNPARALSLSETMIARLRNSENAAYLDTLAKSVYVSGNPEQALVIQREALRHAQAADLWILLQHYDLFRAAAEGGSNAASDAEPGTGSESGRE